MKIPPMKIPNFLDWTITKRGKGSHNCDVRFMFRDEDVRSSNLICRTFGTELSSVPWNRGCALLYPCLWSVVPSGHPSLAASWLWHPLACRLSGLKHPEGVERPQAGVQPLLLTSKKAKAPTGRQKFCRTFGTLLPAIHRNRGCALLTSACGL